MGNILVASKNFHRLSVEKGPTTTFCLTSATVNSCSYLLNGVQYSKVQYSTVEYSAVHYSTVQ